MPPINVQGVKQSQRIEKGDHHIVVLYNTYCNAAAVNFQSICSNIRGTPKSMSVTFTMIPLRLATNDLFLSRLRFRCPFRRFNQGFLVNNFHLPIEESGKSCLQVADSMYLRLYDSLCLLVVRIRGGMKYLVCWSSQQFSVFFLRNIRVEFIEIFNQFLFQLRRTVLIYVEADMNSSSSTCGKRLSRVSCVVWCMVARIPYEPGVVYVIL